MAVHTAVQKNRDDFTRGFWDLNTLQTDLWYTVLLLLSRRIEINKMLIYHLYLVLFPVGITYRNISFVFPSYFEVRETSK